MWAWLLSFFATKAVPVVKHAVWRTISVVCVLLVVGGIIWSIYVTVVRPHTKPTSTQTVQSGGVANTFQIKMGFGSCARISPEIKK
jgi:hypothetical protein